MWLRDVSPRTNGPFLMYTSDDHQVMSSLYDASTRSPDCSLFGSVSAMEDATMCGDIQLRVRGAVYPAGEKTWFVWYSSE